MYILQRHVEVHIHIPSLLGNVAPVGVGGVGFVEEIFYSCTEGHVGLVDRESVVGIEVDDGVGRCFCLAIFFAVAYLSCIASHGQSAVDG